ncbi:ribosomal silencing factor RsfS [Spirochaetia bacterium]|nr:ribosomal silencing factor RsfS [Spirochaetia bacterium]
MDDMPQTADTSVLAVNLGELLRDARGGDVAVMDLRRLNGWTDFFVLATVTSSTHLSGLERHVKDFSRERGLEILRRSRKPAADDDWCLIDLGFIVVHLMTEKTRAFYELERLWSSAPIIYSSKSSKSTSSS